MSSASPAVSIIVPLFNEAENVPLLQDEIAGCLDGLDYELILIDDGSTDGTTAAIRLDDRVRVMRFERNRGQSAALFAGFRSAMADVIVTLDGDLQNDPADIPKLLEAIEAGADLVCGYRRRRRDSAIKRLSSRIANAVRSRFVGDGVRDTGCTLKAMRYECIDVIVPFKGVHRFIPAFVKAAGYRVVEVPVNHRPRRFGRSKYGIGNRALRATLDMFGVRWLLSRQLRRRGWAD